MSGKSMPGIRPGGKNHDGSYFDDAPMTGVSNRKSNLRVIVAAVFGLAALPALIYAAVEVTSIPRVCGSCHEMAAVYLEWRASEHAEKKGKILASCRDCHLPGWDSPVRLVAEKISHGLKDGYRHLWPRHDPDAPDYLYTLKWDLQGTMTDEPCLRCHAPIRSVEKDVFKTAWGPISGIHASDEAGKLRCTVCHPHMGHMP